MASFDENGRKYTPTKKAYKNEGFINSSQARNIRIMCEYEETLLRLKENKIKASVLFFGSARAKDHEGWEKAVAKAEEELAAATDDESRKAAEKNLEKWKKCEWMGESAEKVAKLAELVTAWAVSRRCVLGREHSFSGVTRYHQMRKSSMDTEPKVDNESGPGLRSSRRRSTGNMLTLADVHLRHHCRHFFYRFGLPEPQPPQELLSSFLPPTAAAAAAARAEAEAVPFAIDENGSNQHLVVCTGGGPGFMEAANKGASRVQGARNMGMGITLPFEQGLNEYVTEELAFEFHYFFTRKFWMLYHCQALVVAPGGFGTLDELFEVLTLKQTGKVQKTLPVILFGKDYWQKVINWQALVEFGTIAQDDVDSLFFTDDPQEALDYLVGCLSERGLKGNEEL
eukprot:g13338.t2